MMARLKSKALWFTFMAVVTCPAAWAAPDHDVQVGPKNGRVHYAHKKGKGQNGFVYLKNNHTIQWSCDSAYAPCDRVGIQFASTNPCTNTIGGPAATVTCKVDVSKITDACTKASYGTKCAVYNTFIYRKGEEIPIQLMDDPEFIVDDSRGPLVLTSALAFLALLIGGYAGYRWGQTQTPKSTP